MRILKIKEAAAFCREVLGLNISERQMRRYADERKLPFFILPSGERAITEEALVDYWKKLQQAALNSSNDNEPHSQHVRRRRRRRK